MKSQILIAEKKKLEYPLFLSNSPNGQYFNFSEPGDIHVYNWYNWTELNKRFNNKHAYIVESNNYYIAYKFLAIKDSSTNIVTVLYMETNRVAYINKNIRDYSEAWKRFGKTLRDEMSYSDKDIIHTNLVGKHIFRIFEAPKFKSISDRAEYGKRILKEYIDKCYPEPTEEESLVNRVAQAC